jgi:hypothetical protein
MAAILVDKYAGNNGVPLAPPVPVSLLTRTFLTRLVVDQMGSDGSSIIVPALAEPVARAETLLLARNIGQSLVMRHVSGQIRWQPYLWMKRWQPGCATGVASAFVVLGASVEHKEFASRPEI